MKKNYWILPEISRKRVNCSSDIFSVFKIYNVSFSFYFPWVIMKNNSLWINIYVIENSENCKKAVLGLCVYRHLHSRISNVSMLPRSELLYTNISTDRNTIQAQLYCHVCVCHVELSSSFFFTFSGTATVESLFLMTIAWLFWGGSKAYSSVSLLWNLWFHNLATSNRNGYDTALLPLAK